LKRYLITGILAVVFAGLLAYAMFCERGPTKKTKEEEAKKVSIIKVAEKKLERIDISGGYREIALEKSGGAWRLDQPVQAPAAQAPVQSIIDNLKDMKGTVADDSALNPADFGLDMPQITVTATLKGGVKKVLRVGTKTPVGEDYYVMHDKDPAVYVVPGYVIDGFNKTENDLRDKSIADKIDREKVLSVAVQAGSGKTVCVRKLKDKKEESAGKKKKKKEKEIFDMPPPEEWFFEGGKKSCASEADSVLGDVGFAEAADFVDFPAPKLADYGLETPAYVLELNFAGGGYWRLDVGTDQNGKFFVRNSARGKIYGIDKSFAGALDAFRKESAKL
jgi:hypothetical protein